jgi:AcrR family transcriptional regulator
MAVSTGKTKRPLAPTRDAEVTKARILDAAEEEFARGGLMGGRTEAIAANTGVTKAMIYYYFNDKEGLYRAVLERCVTQRMKAMQRVDMHTSDPEEDLKRYVIVFLDESGTNQNLPAIFLHEGIQNQGKYYSQIGVMAIYQPLVDIIERGIASGKFKPIDPMHAALNIVGMCAFYFCAYENVKHLWPSGTDLRSKEMREQHKLTALQQVLGGLLA